jgi:hypothetical protein
MVFSFAAAQSPSEVARVERTDGFLPAAPSIRTAAPQSPGADPMAQPPAIATTRGGDVASPGVDPKSPILASDQGETMGETDVFFETSEI